MNHAKHVKNNWQRLSVAGDNRKSFSSVLVMNHATNIKQKAEQRLGVAGKILKIQCI
jgi:hypothetical protein